jgi:Protein of unknown function (DUF3604)
MRLELKIAALIAPLLMTACGGKYELDDNVARQAVDAPVPEAACRDRNPLRNAFFGDFHVHTAYSADGWKFGVRATPRDAYRYAFGEQVFLYPNDDDGKPTRPTRIDRPLDFMAVTDHSEFFAESLMCTNEQYSQYNSEFCERFREGSGRDLMQALAMILPWTFRESEICGDNGTACKGAASNVWQDTIQAAEEWNDTSENCERTTFAAYEYSSVRLGSNLHRNVIFRNTIVPPLPISTIEAPRDWRLWEALQRDCLDSDTGCDVLAIPHNPNISNGRMFSVDYPGTDGIDEERARAALRVRVEPVVEVMQHKGDSECRADLPGVLGSVDELCANEQFEHFAMVTTGAADSMEEVASVEECGQGFWADWGINLGPSCRSRLNYIRSTLIEGLKEEERLGVNPFKFGLSSSTDTHNGLGGGVAEKTFPGHLGFGDDTVLKRTSWDKQYAGNASNSPGGLIGVWAEENSRESLFVAIKNREVFSTTGPRIKPRLFGGWKYSQNLCDAPNRLETAYADGVPMGQDLPSEGQASAPSFLVSALADPGSDAQPGTALQRLQIVKGWVDSEGQGHEKVFEVAGDANNGATVNVDTCEQAGSGYTQLCSVWSDPEFDAGQRAVYYARAVENPSCRYTSWQCVGLTGDERPESCDDPRNRVPLQERALTSPIWYTPRD